MMRLLLVATGGALIGAGAVLVWIVWYFRDIYR